MPRQAFDIKKTRTSLFAKLCSSRSKYGGKKITLEDADRTPIDYDRLILSAMILGRKLEKVTEPKETVGLMMPSTVGGVVAFFGLSAFGRTVAMLNFTAGARNIRSACEAAKIRTIVTARRFISQANLEPLIEDLKKTYTIVYLDDLRGKISNIDKVRGLLESKAPNLFISSPSPDDVAVLLFTSGTEGAPKGVALSHANLIANVEQVNSYIDLLPSFVVFNPLPIFHSFGLTGGVLLPLFTGMKSFLFPSPLQAKNIVKLIKETGSNILFATDTFINQYIRTADDGDLNTLLFVVCGAERVKPETHDALNAKAGIPIIEGYGATEASPVVAVNQLGDLNRPGTVGKLMPGMEWKLESVPGIDGGGRLYVRGPNVMRGYMRVDEPGIIQELPGGWHDTGDIVSIDGEGIVRIKGRLKRFAKIGGEMVSLGAVEGYAQSIWPDNLNVAISINDPKKGEQVILLTNCTTATRGDLQKWFKEHGVNELALPKKIIIDENIPILGTGKVDYVAAQKLVEASAH